MGDVATLFIKVNSKEVKVGTVALEKLGKTSTTTTKQVDKLATQASKTGKAVNTAFNGSSSSFKIVGRDLSRYITLPLLAVGVASLKASSSLNSGLGQVQTLISDTTTRIYELKGGVESIATQSGKGFDDLTRGLYETISAFQDGADTVGRFNNAVRAGIAGGSTTTEAVKLLSAVTKAYGDTTAAATGKVSDMAFEAVRLGQTTFPELANSIQDVTAIAERMGVTQAEIFGTMATLTGVTGDASKVTTQYARALMSLANPTEAMTTLFAKYKTEQGEVVTNGKQFIQALGGTGAAFKRIYDEAENTGQPLQTYITRQTGIIAVTALANKQFDTYNDKLAQVESSVGATYKALIAFKYGVNEFNQQIAQAKMGLAVMATEIGDVLEPKIAELLNGIVGLTTWFSNLGTFGQTLAVNFALAAAAIGPLMIAFGSLIRMVELFNSASAIMMTTALFSPVGLAVIAAVAVAMVGFGSVMKKNAEYAETLSKSQDRSSALFGSYDELQGKMGDLGDAQEEDMDWKKQLIATYPELSAKVDLATVSYEELAEAIYEVNTLSFFEDAEKDINKAQKAVRTMAYHTGEMKGAIRDLVDASIRAGKLDVSPNILYDPAAMNDLVDDFYSEFKSSIEHNDFEVADPKLLLNNLLGWDVTQQVMDDAAKGISSSWGEAWSLVTDNKILGDFSDDLEEYAEAMGKINAKAQASGFTGIEIGTGDDIYKMADDVITLLRNVQTAEADLDDDDASVVALPETLDKRLKTWADYFASITGIAGEAFAHIETDEKGSAVGFMQGSGVKAANAYSKAFADELELSSTIAEAVGLGFSSEDMASTLDSQLSKTVSDINGLLSAKAHELNKENFGFSVADLLTGDDDSVESMLKIFGMTDSSIKGLISEAQDLKSAFNMASLVVILEDYDKQLKAIATSSDSAFRAGIFSSSQAEKDLATFAVLKSKFADLTAEKARLADQPSMSQDDADRLIDVKVALIETKGELYETAHATSVLMSAMESYGSVGESIVANLRKQEGAYSLLSKSEKKVVRQQIRLEASNTLIAGTIDAISEATQGMATALGEALAGAKSFGEAMGDVALQLAKTLSTLMITAGLQMIIASGGVNPAGYGLVVLGLAGQVGTSYAESLEYNKDGAVYSGDVKKYAKGGALSDMSNTIVDKPTLFANGTAMLGEAGAEAIIPLTRASNGEMGVNASGIGGSSNVTVSVYNYGNETATVTETEGADGQRDISVIIGKQLNSAIASGKADRGMSSRYGVTTKGLN